MFKPKKRNAPGQPVKRKIVVRRDEDDDSVTGDLPPSEAAARPQKKLKEKAISAPAVLSFEDAADEDSAGTFVVKKSKGKARRETAPPPRPAASEPSSSWRSSTAGMYTAEGMAELRRSQPFQLKSARPSGGDDGSGGGGAGAGGSSGGGMRAGAESGVGVSVADGVVFAGEEAELVDEYGERNGLGGGLPGEQELERLRQERAAAAAAEEQLRHEQDADDFIPLDNKVPVPGSRSLSGHGRALGGGNGLAGTGGGGGTTGWRRGENPDGDDDEIGLHQWEIEQARRAAGAAAGAAGGGSGRRSPPGAELPGMAGLTDDGGKAGKVFPSVEEMQKALRRAADRLREVQEREGRQLGRAEGDLEAAGREAEQAEEKAEEAAALFEYFQRVRDRLSDLCGMLREKEGMISEAAATTAALRRQRLAKTLRRRAEDQEDALLDCAAAVESAGPYMAAADGPLAAAGGPVAGAAGVTTASRRSGPVLDEFGRDGGEQHEREREQRARARERRRRQLQQRVRRWAAASAAAADAADARGGAAAASPSSAAPRWLRAGPRPAPAALWPAALATAACEAAASGGEESDAEAEAEERRATMVADAAEVVLEDVDLEIKSLREIRAFFEHWKGAHPAQYAQAYCSTALPKLLEPLVRLEMVAWDPLNAARRLGNGGVGGGSIGGFGGSGGDEEEDEDGQFQCFKWYRCFFDFAASDSSGDGAAAGRKDGSAITTASASDPDRNLVPTLLEHVALPSLCVCLAESYDAWSERETAAAVAAVEEVLVYEPSTAARRQLQEAAAAALAAAVRSLCVPVLKRGAFARRGGGGSALNGAAVAATAMPGRGGRGRAGLGSAAVASDSGGREEQGGSAFSAESGAAAAELFWRQLWRAVKLLGNIALWQDLILPHTLAPIATGELLERRVAPALLRALHGGGKGGGASAKASSLDKADTARAVAACERIAALVPDAWLKASRPESLRTLREVMTATGQSAAAAGELLPGTGAARSAATTMAAALAKFGNQAVAKQLLAQSARE